MHILFELLDIPAGGDDLACSRVYFALPNAPLGSMSERTATAAIVETTHSIDSGDKGNWPAEL